MLLFFAAFLPVIIYFDIDECVVDDVHWIFISYFLSRNTFILDIVRDIAAANNPPDTIKLIFI